MLDNSIIWKKYIVNRTWIQPNFIWKRNQKAEYYFLWYYVLRRISQGVTVLYFIKLTTIQLEEMRSKKHEQATRNMFLFRARARYQRTRKTKSIPKLRQKLNYAASIKPLRVTSVAIDLIPLCLDSEFTGFWANWMRPLNASETSGRPGASCLLRFPFCNEVFLKIKCRSDPLSEKCVKLRHENSNWQHYTLQILKCFSI